MKTRWINGPVRYFNEKERAAYKIEARDGKLWDAQGRPFDTSYGESHWSGAGKAITVMDGDGSLYASNSHLPGQFHHSSFLAGKPVAFAGEIEVQNGNLTWMSNKSGHYQPPKRSFEQFEATLVTGGIDPKKVEKQNFE